eukprot:CAMPEP_0113547924 /NCGR_PEP_ID=MMETSP0015_2-20120614/12619_1 /TAXON_ID=2838 /ORGANISM="Odontella" /LENGTH=297 /DNA_ID=CAMNT_0000448519 /DNA_START=246 /DNA_END=1139 /DNA_ORIENTATION=- /assembly_acc=CAM_ASM_000160
MFISTFRPVLLLSVAPIWSAAAFTGFRLPGIFGATLPGNPAIADFADSQTGQSLKFRLEIGQDKDESTPNLLIDGLHLEFDGADLPEGCDRVPLPGIDGPNPKLSSGPRVLHIRNEGMFVSMEGMTTVEMKGACWELIWRDDAPAGTILCGFDHPEEARRNEHSSSLPKGRVYVSFPVWIAESLVEHQARKADVTKRAEGHSEEMKDHLVKMRETSNPIMKALHFRNAAAAHERLEYSGHRSAAEIPDEADVAPIGGGLLVCREGTVWTKNGSFMGGNHLLLGRATVKPTESVALTP